MDKLHSSFWQLLALVILMFAKGLLVQHILRSSNCAGISGKTQLLYALVLIGRFLNACSYYRYFWAFAQYFIFYFQLVILLLTIGINLLIHRYFKTTYEKQYDNFKIWRLLVPSLLLAVLVGNYDLTWTFSIFLEVVAIVPQFYFIKNAKHVEKHVFVYMCLMTAYKSLLVIEDLNNQIYHRYNYDIINLATGLIQVMLLIDFLVRLMYEKRDESYANNVQDPTHSNLTTISENVNNSRFNDNLKDVVLSPSMLNEKNQKPDATILPMVHEEKKVTFNLP